MNNNIIPRVRMGSESIAHEAEGRMSYQLRGHGAFRHKWAITPGGALG